MGKAVVLVSGNGSNLQALIDAGIEIGLVVSNKSKAYGLERAKIHGIPTLISELKDKSLRKEYDKNLALLIKEKIELRRNDVIVLAGWMHILSMEFIGEFECPIINLHPALPGEFDGINAIKRAFEAFKQGKITRTGVMVHKVIPQVDAGQVIVKQQVEINENDTLESLEKRIHDVEHLLIVKAVEMLIK